jgi:hypothetical protein
MLAHDVWRFLRSVKFLWGVMTDAKANTPPPTSSLSDTLVHRPSLEFVLLAPKHARRPEILGSVFLLGGWGLRQYTLSLCKWPGGVVYGFGILWLKRIADTALKV